MLPLTQFNLESGAKLQYSPDKKTQTYAAALRTCHIIINVRT